MLVAIVGFFMLLSIAPAPGDVRMAASMLPALILLVWFLDSPRSVARRIAAVIGLGTLVVTTHSVGANRPHPVGILSTPHGNVAFIDPVLYQEDSWIQQHTHPSDYFYESLWQDAYFYFDLRNPTPLSVVKQGGYTTPQQVAEVIQGIGKHQVRYLLCGDWVNDPGGIDEPRTLSDDFLGPLRDYIIVITKWINSSRMAPKSGKLIQNDFAVHCLKEQTNSAALAGPACRD